MKTKFEKNRLDLAYKKQLTYLNAVVLLATIGALSFIGTFIWNKEYLIYGLLLMIIIWIISFSFYKKIDKNIRNISEEIKNL